MINKILSIRRIGWLIQPPKQWRKNKKAQGGDGFDDVLKGEISMENLIYKLEEIKSDILQRYDGMDYADAEAKAAAIDEAIERIEAQ